jgi:glycosyltransferase involved in cell wall biosynthesis
MNVLHVCGQFPYPPLGGMEAVVYNLGIGLDSSRFSVRIISPSAADRREVHGNCELLGLQSRIVNNWISFPTLPTYRRITQEILWADVVHVHNPPETFNLLAGRRVLRLGRPLVLSVLSPGRLRYHPRFALRILGTFDEVVVQGLISAANLVQVKNVLDHDYVSRLTNRVQIIPDGIEDLFFSLPRRPTQQWAAAAHGGRYPVLLYIGRLHALKGPNDFVETVGLLRNRFPDLIALIAGPGTPSELHRILSRVRELGLENHVRYLGVLSPVDKVRTIDGSDVIVVPSLSDFAEGFSIVCSEAWARRKPVAAYPVGALKARVRNGANGWLAQSNHPPALAEAVKLALEVTNVQPPRDVVGWPQVVDPFERIYANLASSGTRKPFSAVSNPGPR